MLTKEESQQTITGLIAKYEALSQKEIKGFNEANTKQGFILPLFAALGWDAFDTHEVAMEEAASNKRVDFAFKINGVARFYLEAKPLKADLNNPDYIKQAITYAYSNGVTWAVLTNFEELRLLNAQKSTPFIQLAYKEYLSSFDKLWLLSREAVAADALSKEATQYGALPPLIPIEEKLFKQLRNWRGVLFNQLYHYNDWLRAEQRDEVIEKLFNRLIFIRTAEDRKLEERNLRASVHKWESGGHKKGELASSLREIFAYYTNYYDSDLFKQHLLDSERLYIDEYAISDILTGLYEIPGGIADYDFSIIDADVLGRVYEQYLGYVAKIEQEKAKEKQAQLGLGFVAEKNYQMVEKKIHRKEQGIYYTPKFVTDFIVKETVGRFIQENEADSYNKIVNMKILDPACGSGSFLIRAYDELLNYHARVRGKAASELDQQDRMPILTGNIFGVDLDRQAVEIARLNLLLRGLAKRDHLPPLTDNIKQGNSLISGTEKEMEGYFGKDWKEKHPFNWEDEFKDVLAGGGFDVVIGNPPYGAELDEYERGYIADHYPRSKDNKNSAMVFIEKGLKLTKEGGYFGFIIPKSLAYSQKWTNGRQLILEQLGIAADTSKAFIGVLLEQMVIIVSKRFAPTNTYYALNLDAGGITKQIHVEKETARATDTILMGIDEKELQVFNRMTSSGLFMKDISQTVRGLPYQKHLVKGLNGIPIFRGDHIGRYILHDTYEVIPESTLEGADKKVAILHQTKIMSQQIIAHVMNPYDRIILMSTLDKTGILTLDTVQNTILTDKRYLYTFVLGLMNSKLWSWYGYNFIFSKAVRTMHFDEYYMEKFPMPSVHLTNPFEKAMHDRLVALVEKMLELNKELAPIRDQYSHKRDELVNDIEKTDSEIDDLVFDLYGLTEEERKIV